MSTEELVYATDPSEDEEDEDDDEDDEDYDDDLDFVDSEDEDDSDHEAEQDDRPVHHNVVNHRVKRMLFKEPLPLTEISMLGLMDRGPHVLRDPNCAARSVFRDFLHINYSYSPSLTLKIKRALYLGKRCFMLLLSDSYCCKWALVVNDEQMMNVASNFREKLHNLEVRVCLHKRTPQVGNAFLLATNIRVSDAESDDDLQDYTTTDGLVLPGSAFGKAAVGPPYSGNPGMLICNGPRIDADSGEVVMSFVNACIPGIVRMQEFGARLCVVRVEQSQILLTDGTDTIAAFFVDELKLLDGVFLVEGKLSAKLAVGNVLDVQAYGYSHANHQQKWHLMEHYPTCLVSKCTVHEGREWLNPRMLALSVTAPEPATDLAVELANRVLRRKGHEAARVRSMVCGQGPGIVSGGGYKTLLGSQDALVVVLPMLKPMHIFMLCQCSKSCLEAVLNVYVDARAVQDSRIFKSLLIPRAALALRTDRLENVVGKPLVNWNLARDTLYIHFYENMSLHLLHLSLSMATGGLAHYQASSLSRFFELDRVFGRYILANMKTCRCLGPSLTPDTPGAAPRTTPVRCVRCEVKNEYSRYLWASNTMSPASYSPLSQSADFDTAMRVRLKLRHRYMFRHDPLWWRIHDNLCYMLPRMPSNFLVEADFRSHVDNMDKRLPSEIFRVVSGVKAFQLNVLSDGEKHIDYLQQEVAMQNWLFPLVPGSLQLLEKDSTKDCVHLFQAWKDTERSGHQQTVTVDAAEFMPARRADLPHLRLVLQITSTLMHGVRVLYVHREDGKRDCLVHSDDDMVSFWAHDGHHELAFSTDCPSFMLMLDQALFSQELDEDFQHHQNMSASHDLMRTWVGESEANVLANYLVSCSVHDVGETAHISFADFWGEEHDYATVMHEQRAFDFVLLDTKIPLRNFIEEKVVLHRRNLLSSHILRLHIETEQLQFADDERHIASQHWRRIADIAMPRWQAIDDRRVEYESEDAPEPPDAPDDEVEGPTQPYVAPDTAAP